LLHGDIVGVPYYLGSFDTDYIIFIKFEIKKNLEEINCVKENTESFEIFRIIIDMEYL
jgi:hypothetical protein